MIEVHPSYTIEASQALVRLLNAHAQLALDAATWFRSQTPDNRTDESEH